VALVASEAPDEAWDIVIGAAEGDDLAKEVPRIADTGSPVSPPFADIYFPDLTCSNHGREYSYPGWYGRVNREQINSARSGIPPSVPRPEVMGFEALDEHVLLVECMMEDHTWTVRVGDIDGLDYWKDLLRVFETGSSVPFEVAEIYFGDEAKDSEMGAKYRPEADTFLHREYVD
jgi:hypothetical protein